MGSFFIWVQTKPRFTAPELAESSGSVGPPCSGISVLSQRWACRFGRRPDRGRLRAAERRQAALAVSNGGRGAGLDLLLRVLPALLGVSEQVIYPFGVYAFQGFWYCFCHDHRREEIVSLRADRFRNVEPVEGFTRSDVRPWGFLVSAYSAGEFFCACNEQKITKSAYTCRYVSEVSLEILQGDAPIAGAVPHAIRIAH
jgi:hypothetical protein